MKHYKYGGSSAQRTISCPSWVDLAAKMPSGDESSPAAQEGTMLHDQMEQMLEGQLDFDRWTVGGALEDDQVERLNMALDAWDDLCKGYHVIDFATEQTFEINPETGGTCDVIAWSKDRLVIVDWKFGQGIPVEAEGNMQALFYAMAAEAGNNTFTYDPSVPLTVVIIQPMPSRSEPTLKVWDVPADVYEVFKRTYITAQGAVGLHTGDHCRWCPAASICPEKTGEAVLAKTLDPTELGIVSSNLELAMSLESWITEVKSTAHLQLENGAEVTGFKLVAKRVTRKWIDPNVAETFVRDAHVKRRLLRVRDITELTFLSAPKLEKLFKAKSLDFDQLSAYIDSSSSGTTLAREDDPREGIMSGQALKAALGRLT